MSTVPHPPNRDRENGRSPTSSGGSVPFPFSRIRQTPRPARRPKRRVWLNDHEDRLYELVDGILVEKTVGLEESWLAVRFWSR